MPRRPRRDARGDSGPICARDERRVSGGLAPWRRIAVGARRDRSVGGRGRRGWSVKGRGCRLEQSGSDLALGVLRHQRRGRRPWRWRGLGSGGGRRATRSAARGTPPAASAFVAATAAVPKPIALVTAGLARARARSRTRARAHSHTHTREHHRGTFSHAHIRHVIARHRIHIERCPACEAGGAYVVRGAWWVVGGGW